VDIMESKLDEKKANQELIAKYKERIAELKKEIEQFNYERLKRIERAQQLKLELQEQLSQINQAILTRRGEIIGLKRLIREEKENESDTPENMRNG